MAHSFFSIATKQIFLGRVFFLVLLCVMVTAARPAQAGAWGEPTAAAIWKQLAEKMQRQIEGAVLGTLKVTAINMLNNQVGQLVGGSSSGGALFITDWNDFLYASPARITQLYMNDFFTITTRGKASSVNYVGLGDTLGGVSGNYPGFLVAQAEQAIGTGGNDGLTQFDLDSYTPSPDAMFEQGNWRAFSSFVSNPANNPYGYTLMAEAAYRNKLAQEMELVKTKAQSSGFKGKEENGRTLTPAGSIEAMVANVQNMGNNLISNATNPGEFLSGVVGAVVNRTVNNLVQKGIGQIQSNIQREVGSINREISGALNDATKNLGPAAGFGKDLLQRTNVSVRPSTLPPPAAKAAVCSLYGVC